MNRKREAGWLTPTATHLLRTHENLVDLVCKILPVGKVVLEINKFAFMAMDNPNIKRWEYQKGSLHGYGSVEAAVTQKFIRTQSSPKKFPKKRLGKTKSTGRSVCLTRSSPS